MSAADRQRWDEKYQAKTIPAKITPDDWLIEQASDLKPGRALELACGLGHNAIWLAQHGWHVDAVDISAVGLAHAETLSQSCGATVHWIASDLDEFMPAADTYDLVLVFRYLDRRRLPSMIQQAVRPHGRLIYETFTKSHIDRPDSHMKNPAFALNPGELPQLFPQFKVMTYAECSFFDRDVARLVAMRPQRP